LGSARSNHRKERERRAASRRLEPIRGARGRSLQHRRLGGGRVVGLGQFAEGLTRHDGRRKPRSGLVTWALAAVPFVILLIFVVARLTRHL
jgi:hypothetical protein